MEDYPCNTCLITPICNKQCYKVFEFMNNAADMLFAAGTTADEVHKYRTTSPAYVLHQVDELVRDSKKFAYPENIQSCWGEMLNKKHGAGSE